MKIAQGFSLGRARVERTKSRRDGRAGASAVPAETDPARPRLPNAEALGDCQLSLWDTHT